MFNNNGWSSLGQIPAPGQFTPSSSVTFSNLPSDTFRVIMIDSSGCIDTLGEQSQNITALTDNGQIILNNSGIIMDDELII